MRRVYRRLRAGLGALTFATFLLAGSPAFASAAQDLVRMARAHEQAHEEDLALRRYTEALSLDATCADAYIGLARLRARTGDLREAERVYDVALEHLPGLRTALLGRAYVRRALGARAEATQDLLTGAEDDPGALRVLAGWYAEDGQFPAQLGVWRRIVARAEATEDAVLLHEARTTVRALLILVGPADPAASPAGDTTFRRFVATLARRGG